jgi:hypothetical protein
VAASVSALRREARMRGRRGEVIQGSGGVIVRAAATSALYRRNPLVLAWHARQGRAAVLAMAMAMVAGSDGPCWARGWAGAVRSGLQTRPRKKGIR